MAQQQKTRGIKTTQVGLLANLLLVLVKLLAGIFGNTYALIADAAESSMDIVSSVIVWTGLSIAATPPDEEHPFGHGRAEALAGAAVALLLILAAVGIAAAAVQEIVTPHEPPKPFTLLVALGVIVIKEILFRRVLRVGTETGSVAVKADAWHHRSDAISSLAASIGIAIALEGGPGWESADDWAALVAAAIIGINGVRMLRPALQDLMDRMPEPAIVEQVASAARSVDGVRAIEKLKVRRLGTDYYVDIHVQADPLLSLREAHIVAGKVKSAIRASLPAVFDASIHMEPFEGPIEA